MVGGKDMSAENKDGELSFGEEIASTLAGELLGAVVGTSVGALATAIVISGPVGWLATAMVAGAVYDSSKKKNNPPGPQP